MMTTSLRLLRGSAWGSFKHWVTSTGLHLYTIWAATNLDEWLCNGCSERISPQKC